MLTCSKCGRKFKSRAALGGHTSHAHQADIAPLKAQEAHGDQPSETDASTALLDETENQPVQDEGESLAEEIRGYLERGYSFKQLTEEFHFKESTVRQEMAKLVPPEGDELGKFGDGLPVMRKIGGGAEVITPEAVLRSYMAGDGGEEQELRGMMKLRAAMLMVMDLVNIRKADSEAYALMVKPILEMMKEARMEQDAAAERAKASVSEAAMQAAEEAAARVAAYLDRKKPDIASTPSPFEGMMARTLETAMGTLLNKLFPGAEADSTPGFTVRERRKGD